MPIKQIKMVLTIVTGSILMAISSIFFMAPMHIVSGGSTGVAIALNNLFQIPIDLTIAVMVWGLFILGYFLLGKRFTINTAIATVVYPIAVYILLRFVPENPIGFDLANDTHKLLASIFGGAIGGIGVAITFLVGGSTGGVDVIILSLKKYFGIKTSLSALIVDATIIAFGMATIGVIIGLYGIITAVVSSALIEFVLIGFSSLYQATIISKKSKDINQWILTKMERGSTLIKVVGGYTAEEYQMIQVAFDRKDLVRLRNKIREIDPKAFAIFTNIKSITGEGFDAAEN